jgi:hypothetical protein
MRSSHHIQKEPQKWLDEIQGAIGAFGDRSNCGEAMLKRFVTEAPERAALINGIDDSDLIHEMKISAWQNLEVELRNGADLKEGFSLVFALCYLDSLVSIDLITEKMSEEIMQAISWVLSTERHNQ